MKSMKTLKRMGDSGQPCLTPDRRGKWPGLDALSPYACIAVSVEVLDQVHQFRGQAPSPKSTLWLTRSKALLKSTNAACMGASYCRASSINLFVYGIIIPSQHRITVQASSHSFNPPGVTLPEVRNPALYDICCLLHTTYSYMSNFPQIFLQ